MGKGMPIMEMLETRMAHLQSLARSAVGDKTVRVRNQITPEVNIIKEEVLPSNFQPLSGTDKVKSKRRDSSLGEQRRASSLDSVTLQTCVSGSLVQAEDVERKRSSSTQSLKVI